MLCETPTTSIAALIERIQQRQANIQTEETAVQHLILCDCTATGTSVGRSCLLPSWGQRGSILGDTLDSVLVGETCGCSEPSPRANWVQSRKHLSLPPIAVIMWSTIESSPHPMPCRDRSRPMDQDHSVSYAAEMDGHVLGALWAVTMALLTNRLDLCIQALFGAGKSKSMAILILALLELDIDHRLRILFLCKENSRTRSFADLLQWLDRPVAVLKEEIKPAIPMQDLISIQENEGKCLHSVNWSWPQGHSQPRHHAVVHHGQFHARLFTDDKDEGQQYGTDREIATISLLRTQPLILWTGDAAPNAKRSRQLLLAKQHGLRSNRK